MHFSITLDEYFVILNCDTSSLIAALFLSILPLSLLHQLLHNDPKQFAVHNSHKNFVPSLYSLYVESLVIFATMVGWNFLYSALRVRDISFLVTWRPLALSETRGRSATISDMIISWLDPWKSSITFCMTCVP